MRRSPTLPTWHALLALLLLAAVFVVYVLLEKRIDQENRRHHESVMLVDVLRQSSDDLTRMARSLVITGDARYGRAFSDISAIRDGRLPWPEGYDGVYWDLVLAGARMPDASGPRMALLDRMREAGFTDEELRLLAEAKSHSDALTRTEYEAMALAAGDAAQRQHAIELLHDAGYHASKAATMAPIDAVLRSVEARTSEAVADAVARAAWARAAFIGMALLLAVLLLRAQWRLRRLLGAPVDALYARLTRIGQGEFAGPQPQEPVPESSVMGRLLQTEHRLQVLDGERLQALHRLQLSAGVFTHAREGILITDAGGLIVDVNDAFTRLTGYSREELIGASPRLLDSGRHPSSFFAQMVEDLDRHDQWQGEIWDRRKDGSLFASLETVSTVRNEAGRVTHYVTLMTDITAMKEQAQRLAHIAHYDALTGLPNRVLLGDRLQHAMQMAPRHPGLRIAVVYLDLDGFKAVNDAQGHDTGDRLLVELATRLRSVLREGDTLARLGGDEFIAVLLDLPDTATCDALLTRMLREIAQPFALGDGAAVQVSGSLGVSFYPQADAVDADQLLRQADQAMYQAKLAGKNRVQHFDTEQAAQLRGQMESVASLRQALLHGELLLHYQPKVKLRSGEVVGVEALIRWLHPERGLLAPGQFLPLVEDHPLICEIGDWVIATGLAQLAVWRAQGLHIGLSVNVAARHLQQPDFCSRTLAALQRHPELQPQDLIIEVLESSALDDLVGVSRTLAEGSARGLAFALDDFGTGYSSLTYLRRLPVTQLKIDQSFVRDMLDDADDLAILDGVIGLAAAFRREVIAEGVESAEHGAVLLRLGCELAQGYGIGRPMPADALPLWVRDWRPPAAWRALRPAGREQLPLLRASLDNQARARGLARHLAGQREVPPALDPASCRLSAWLLECGDQAPRLRAAFEALRPLRQQLLHRRRQHGVLGPGERASLAQAESALQQMLDDLLGS